MTKQYFILAHDGARSRAVQAVASAPTGYVIEIKEPTRSLDQNAAQWPILQALANNLLWPVNGQMSKITDAEWKDVLSASFKKETARLAMGIDGGVVMLGKRTSKFKKKEFSDWIEYLHWFASFKGVQVYQEALQ